MTMTTTDTATRADPVALVHNIDEVAVALRLVRRNGDPNRAAVYELIRSGAIRLVGPDQPLSRWTVATAELERYVAHGPRRGADIVSLGFAS